MPNNTNPYTATLSPFLLKVLAYLYSLKIFSLARLLFIDFVLRWFLYAVTYIFRKTGNTYFVFNKKTYSYNMSSYNKSWSCERAVEIPIALDFIKQRTGNLLEVGCVLPHYQKPTWEVLDKFEQYTNVINEDILTFKPTKPYDRIVSISTVEHVGIDDETHDSTLGIAAIEQMKKWLATNGTLMVTIPVNYNPSLDDELFQNSKIFSALYGVKRTSAGNTWKQVDLSQMRKCRYGWPYNNANGLLIGIYTKGK